MRLAAQCLEQAELAEPTLELTQNLAQRHPPAEPPDMDISYTMPSQITSEILVQAVQRLPWGSSGVSSAWMYEHVNAACVWPAMFEATLQFMNSIVASNLSEFRYTMMPAGAPYN